MSSTQQDETVARGRLRLWPGVIIALLLGISRFVIPWILPDSAMFAVLGGLLGAVAVVVWWLFFSRAIWWEGLGGIVLMVIVLLLTSRIVHESLANGMMEMLLPIYALPVLSLALVVWAVVGHHFDDQFRLGGLVGIFLLIGGVFALLRTGGIDGSANSDFHWRWTQTPEERLLAQTVSSASTKEMSSRTSAKSNVYNGRIAKSTHAMPSSEWRGFRGRDRDSVVRGIRISTNWIASPPKVLWQRAIGPGWSSFAVHGNFLYTQEQRGDQESVVCYRLDTGELVWKHFDEARFWESNAGAGPRGTPALGRGRVYTLGATGLLNALDAATGAVVWRGTPALDTTTKVPGWGFAGSPLLVENLVVVAVAGTLVAYDAETGVRRWVGPVGSGGYSSPHLITLDGVSQILLANGSGITSVAPADGQLYWKYSWPNDGIVQPSVVPGGEILVGSGSGIGGAGVGIRRIGISKGLAGWTIQERWNSVGLKPYFNDFVVYQDHVFGLDGSFLACVGLSDGKRQWKDGGYGNGQLLLLSNQGILLILTESGQLVLVRTDPRQFAEVARFDAIRGKTWNHPVLVGDVALVRNSEEMAAIRLPLEPN